VPIDVVYELVAQTLVRRLLITMLDKRAYGSLEVPFAEWHDPLQALGLGGRNKPLGKRVQIWTPGKKRKPVGACET
jgi:hypothetical protein